MQPHEFKVVATVLGWLALFRFKTHACVSESKDQFDGNGTAGKRPHLRKENEVPAFQSDGGRCARVAAARCRTLRQSLRGIGLLLNGAADVSIRFDKISSMSGRIALP